RNPMSSIHLHPHTEVMPEPQVKQVGPGIYAYVQLDGSWGLNNPAFFVGSRAVTLVDTCFTEARGRALRAAIGGVSDLPVRRLLVAGDLVFSRCTPFVVMGSLAGHLRALETLRDLGAETIVPGHGDICGPEGIQDGIAYLRFVQEVARKDFDAGMTPLEAAR